MKRIDTSLAGIDQQEQPQGAWGEGPDGELASDDRGARHLWLGNWRQIADDHHWVSV